MRTSHPLVPALALAALLAAAAVVPAVRAAAPAHPAAVADPGASDPRVVLPFRHDDWAGAIAEARARHVPLFVDVWAPWCHTCRSMWAYVFTDERLTGERGRFVWLSLDSEKPQNAPLRQRLAWSAIPVFYVVDPSDEHVAMKWVGSLTLTQLTRFLADARLAVERRGEPAGRTPADSALARADRFYGLGDDARAAAAYRAALAAAVPGWPPYARALESMLFAGQRVKDYAGCALAARDALPRLGRTSSAADAASIGLDCAGSLDAADPRRAELIHALLPPARALAADEGAVMAADDRSGLYISIGDALEALGDTLTERANTEAWAAFLEREAARAPTPDARAVFDSHRLSAYLALGQPERALPMLQASERDLPGDYDPPARLAAAYRALRRWDEGLAAIGRAMTLAYGPRKLNFFQLRADLQLGRGDDAAARRTLEEAIVYAEALPPGQRNDATITGLRQRLERLHS